VVASREEAMREYRWDVNIKMVLMESGDWIEPAYVGYSGRLL